MAVTRTICVSHGGGDEGTATIYHPTTLINEGTTYTNTTDREYKLKEKPKRSIPEFLKDKNKWWIKNKE